MGVMLWIRSLSLASLGPLRFQSLVQLRVLLDGFPPCIRISSNDFPTSWIDTTCRHVALAHTLVAKYWPYCTSEVTSQLDIEHIFWDATISRTADMTEPTQAPLSKKGKHAWYAHLCQDGFGGQVVMPCNNAYDPSETASVENIKPVFLVKDFDFTQSLKLKKKIT